MSQDGPKHMEVMYNPCNDLAPLFQQMFAGHEVAEHFSLGKTKSRYIMLCGIAL